MYDKSQRPNMCCDWDGDKERWVIDLSTISRVWEINGLDWAAYCDERDKTWVRHIKYPVTERDLDLMVTLSRLPDVKYEFGWSAGELFYKEKLND